MNWYLACLLWIGRLNSQIDFMNVSDNESRTFEFVENYTTVLCTFILKLRYISCHAFMCVDVKREKKVTDTSRLSKIKGIRPVDILVVPPFPIPFKMGQWHHDLSKHQKWSPIASHQTHHTYQLLCIPLIHLICMLMSTLF